VNAYKTIRAVILVAFVALVGVLLQLKKNSPLPAPRNPSATTNQANSPVPNPMIASAAAVLQATNTTTVKSAVNPVAQTFAWFQVHPFKVAESNSIYAWTAEDGKSTNVIRQLAHNDLEYARMVAENPTIFRRQLIYHPEGFTLLAQQAVQSGQSIQQLSLPGLDGRSVPVAVTKTDFESGGDRGLFYGRLPDDPNSLVTVAFINGREAFTVVSLQNRIYLQGEAREPGEIVVKSIDPKTYGGNAD